jgi:catechol 2,3-dioxygenase-like lactoylglutathione lyase family enzyme
MQRIRSSILLIVALALCTIANAALARALALDSVALTVSDLDRSVAFYENALGFRKISEHTIADRNHDYVTGVFGTRVRSATLRLGDETIQLEQFVSPAGRPIPADSRSNDLWFQHFAVVVADMERAHEHVRRFGVQSISSAPQTIPESNRAAAGIKAWKFRDPDGHPLELLWFPAGKGNPKWQDGGDGLFLGIDHSAITISDTERSTAFYRDLIGLAVLGGGVNSGPTQEQLDNAFGAVVRITGLRPERPEGPGLEFLQYLTPGGGRPAAVDARLNDLVATRVVIEVDDLHALADKLQRHGAAFVSPDVVTVANRPYRHYLAVKDPDGHAVLLVQR